MAKMQPPSGREPPGGQAPLLRTKSLTKRYGSVVALDTLDLELQPGVIGLVGANGGKSTLISTPRLLERRADRGSARFNTPSGPATAVRRVHARNTIACRRCVRHLFVRTGAGERLPGAAPGTSRDDSSVGLFEERYREMRCYSRMKQRVKLPKLGA